MNLNMHIIMDELSNLRPIAFIDDSIELSISSIAHFDGTLDAFLQDTLYLVNAFDITSCEGKLKGANIISIGLIDDDFAARNYCNIICLSDSLSIVELASLIFIIQKKYDEWNNRMLSAIISKQPMKEFFDITMEELHSPMMIFGPLNTLILSVGDIPDSCTDSLWREVLDQGYFPYEHPLYNEFLKTADRNFKESHAFILKFPKHDYVYLVANIFQDGKRCGSILLIETNSSFTLGQISLVTHFRSILEQAIRNIPDFQIFSSNSNSFAYQLLKHVYLKESIIINSLKFKGWKVFDAYYSLYFILDQKKYKKDVILDILMQELNRIFPFSMTLDYKNGVVVILRNSDFTFDQNNLRTKLFSLVEKFSLIVGISSVFYDFKNLKRHYDECNLAIKYGQVEKSDISIHFFQDYVIKHLTRFVFVENGKNQFIHTKVELLHKYDQKNDTELVNTLLVYFQHGQSKSLAAEKMHTHRNTLIYRLESINKIAGIECNDRNMNEDEIFHIMLSCKFLQYQGDF